MFADVETAPVSDRVKAALHLIEILTVRPDDLSGADLDTARSHGLDDGAIRDAAMVCSMFSIITRLADTLEFDLPASFEGSAKALSSKMGYRMPAPALMWPKL